MKTINCKATCCLYTIRL